MGTPHAKGARIEAPKTPREKGVEDGVTSDVFKDRDLWSEDNDKNKDL